MFKAFPGGYGGMVPQEILKVKPLKLAYGRVS